MSVIEPLREFIMTCPLLEEGSPFWVNWLNTDSPIQYAIVPLPGMRIMESYIDGSTIREFPFAVRSSRNTQDDLLRLESSAFFEELAEWFEQQSADENFPTLDEGKQSRDLRVDSWGNLMEEGSTNVGIYQLNGTLTYYQEKY